MELTRLTAPQTLPEQYRRYLAINAAHAKMAQITQWPDYPPTQKQVTELVIGKSQWSHVWQPTFLRVTQHFPKMTQWLNGDPDSLTEAELWGQYRGTKGKHTLKNLQAWMDNGGKISKGKERAVEEKIAGSSSTTSPEKKKKKKKKSSEKSEK